LTSPFILLQITGGEAAGRVGRFASHAQAGYSLRRKKLKMSKLQDFMFYLSRFLMMPDDLCRYVVAANKDPDAWRSAATSPFAQ